MEKILALLALLLGAMLVPMSAIAGSGKKDCNRATDPLCDVFKNPRERALKHVPCVPVRFDQLSSGTVAVEIINKRLGTRRSSRNFKESGQYCFGEHWLKDVAKVTICDDDKSFVWTPTMVSAALAQNKKVRGLDGTLKGTRWYTDHKERYD